MVSYTSGREILMFTARRSVQAVAAVLVVSSVVSLPAFSQSAQFSRVEARSLHALRLSASTNPCLHNSNRFVVGVPGDASKDNSPLFPCDRPISSAIREMPVTVAPCNPSTQATIPCSASSDAVRDDLNTMGKQGQSILRARDKVLEILQTGNACTAWYRTKEPDPASAFRTLTFALDRDGESYVRKILESGGIELIRNPYVARVMQGGGLNSTVSINLHGAFFFPMAGVVEDRLEGGPLSFRGARAIQVGPYAGGTFRAQVVALLHEFGHVIDLLPPDHDDYEGKSRQNTLDVLQACRAEVESKEKLHTLSASR